MINTVSQINKAIKTDVKGFILGVEAEYHAQIEQVAKRCVESDIRIIMLAGPSGSGKTTTAHILRDDIRDLGHYCEVISLDDFYMEKSKIPLGADNKPDFETVHALDIEEFKRCILNLQNKGQTYLPVFDFKTGPKYSAKFLDIKNGGVVIIEGLHALNPIMLENIDSSTVLKMYISVNTPLCNDDGTVAMTSRLMRLIRRTCRDALYRGADISHTLGLWSNVCAGEHKYLYVFKDTADIKISTFHSFEPAVFRDNMLKMLETLSPDCENYDYVIKAKNVLEKIEPINFDLLPLDSLIREFVPGGKYE